MPGKVTLVTCCSTAPTFTTLAAEGKTGGYLFRTIPTTKTMAYAAARVAAQRGHKKTAVIYVNTDFGVNMARDFERAFQKLGGTVAVSLPYNENQPSYRAEVNRALAATPTRCTWSPSRRTAPRSPASGCRSAARRTWC